MSIHNILSQMEHHMPILVLLLLLIKSCNSQLLSIVDDETHKYIIDVERHEQHELLSDSDLERFHLSFLPNSTLDSGAPRLIYSYRHVLNGFAARLTQEELETIKLKPGFLYAQRNCYYPLATTYTPRYLGLTMNNAWGSTMMGQGLIIGILDTGIKASHPSFKDTNMSPPPPVTKWKGSCFNGFACNNKIIGAKAFFNGSNPSPKDTEGHGTHVASIAAGNFVKNANVLGMAKGDPASGVAPMAHLSIYKVCFPNSGCAKIDIYAAIDQAIKDGVDIISMSIGGGTISTLYDDAISRGSMAVIQHGIVPITAAGNDGPDSASLSGSSAPWLLTVGASTTDRRVTSIVELGNGRTFPGESAYQPKSWNSSAMWQLEYPGENGDQDYRCCVPSVMTNLNLRGKIVLCVACEVKDDVRGEAAYKAGAMGMIVMNHPLDGYTTQSPAHILPAANVDYRTRLDILSYYNNNKPNASAAIRFDGTHFGFKPSPTVASFSSRGPSSINGGIIKPDVLAPGVNILAAWHTDVGPNPNPLATHTFNFDSGTSMATPHVSGIVALVKSKHRGWTPAEILSAIVTTANDAGTVGGDLIVDSSYDSAGIYAMGAGEVNPIKAMDPGLVFGLAFEDYVGYLCGLAYNNTEVTLIVGKQMNCSGIKHLSASELNYPSIAVNLTRLVKSQKVTRTAKNVGDAREEYMAKITEPVGVRVDLSTYTLKFTRVDQEVSYDINFVLNGAYPSQGSEMIRRGKIVWDSGKHVVTTPIAVRFV